MAARWTLIAATVAMLSTPTRAALGGSEGGVLLYTHWAGFNSDIMRATPGGGDVTNLTAHPLVDQRPAWSPDGQRIAFSSRRDGESRLYVMDADGGGVRRLNDRDHHFGKATWSRDGQRIAVVLEREGPAALYTVRVADGAVELITEEPRLLSSRGPDWSPEGRHIALTTMINANEGRRSTIWVMNMRDGSAHVVRDNRDNPSRHSAEPAWSPDGQRIAFASFDDDHPVTRIHTMARDGSDVRVLTEGNDQALQPVWSPDGGSIAYLKWTDDGEQSAQVMDADGGPPRALLPPALTILDMDWWGPELLDVSARGKRPFTWGWLKRMGTGQPAPRDGHPGGMHQ